jgi:beta-lactamase regulating signal transducer with metallopeptidase domain
MTDFVIYMLKSAWALGIFYLLYFLLFRKETFYHFNRIYILGSMVISLIIPSLNITLSPPVSHVQNNFNYVNHAFLDFGETMEYVQTTTAEKVESFPIIQFLLLAGMLVAMVHVVYQLISIYRKILNYEVKKQGKYHYVLIDQHQSTHSFFNYIFVHKSEFQKKQMKDVLLHEQIHADHGHSVDLLFIGFLSILQWFNPFIYLFKRALVETHEFQADEAVIDRGIDRNQYQRLLLEHARSVVMTGLTCSFNQSIIKNRLKMMNKIKSSNKAFIKYLMVFPVVFFLGIVFAISQDKIDDALGSSLTFKDGKLSFGYADDKLSYSAEDSMIVSDDIVSLYGNAKVESVHASINSDIIYVDKSLKEVYTMSDNVPSISPIDVTDYKKITSGFGMRMHPVLKKEMMHNGMDFSAETGTAIKSTANGTVRSAKYADAYGNRVIIDHGSGFSTSYNQMEKYLVEAGQTVKKGEVIGYVGSTGLSTGPHLHYEVMKDGKFVDPADYIGQIKE